MFNLLIDNWNSYYLLIRNNYKKGNDIHTIKHKNINYIFFHLITKKKTKRDPILL